jgi:hypothetical protein
MDNPFSKYFSGQSPISTANYEPQEAEDYLSSGDVLGRPTAKNTAQRGISQSKQMKDAYENLSDFNIQDLFKQEYEREKGKGVNVPFFQTSFAKEAEFLNKKEAEGQNLLSGSDRKAAAEKKNAVTKFYQALSQGMSWEDAVKKYPQSGFGVGYVPGWSSSGAGAGITQARQTSTSNVLEYGKEYQMRGEGGKPLYTSSGKPVTTSELSKTQMQEQFKGTFGRYGSEEELDKFQRGEYESGLQARGYISPSELQKQQQKQNVSKDPSGMEKGHISNQLYPSQQDNQ